MYALLRHNRYYDIVKFQFDLVILASSKNFDNRLYNLKCFFLFSRDFVLEFSRLFFVAYITRQDFIHSEYLSIRV